MAQKPTQADSYSADSLGAACPCDDATAHTRATTPAAVADDALPLSRLHPSLLDAVREIGADIAAQAAAVAAEGPRTLAFTAEDWERAAREPFVLGRPEPVPKGKRGPARKAERLHLPARYRHALRWVRFHRLSARGTAAIRANPSGDVERIRSALDAVPPGTPVRNLASRVKSILEQQGREHIPAITVRRWVRRFLLEKKLPPLV